MPGGSGVGMGRTHGWAGDASMASSKKYSVGAEVEAHCGSCKLNRLHVIETLKSDGNINRVMCRTCDGSHLFRRPKSEAGKKASAKRRKAGAVMVTDAELKKAKPYAMDGVFKAGDIIKHPTFGPGKVLEVKSGGRIEVGFEGGGKRLVCGSG